jgi:flagellar motility protein MotE (MotC chaperone)
MCDELGDEDIMAAFVEDAAGIVSGCSLDGTGCDDRSLAFLNKWKDKKPQEINNELDRLMSLIESDMKHELKDWVKERRVILQRIVDQSEEVKTEL